MSITVQCPGCFKSLGVRPQHLGRRVKCPSCGTVVSIPTAPEEEFEDKFEMPAPPPIKKKRTSPISKESIDKKTDDGVSRRSLRDIRIPLWGMIVAPSILSLLLGYYIGREHVKHQLFSAFSQGFGEIAKGVGEFNSGQIQELEDAEAEPPKPLPRFNIGQAYETETFSIAVTSAKIENPQVKQLGGDLSVAKEPGLILRFEIKNKDDRKVLEFFTDDGDCFSLVDDVGNTVQGVSYGLMADVVGAIKDELPPGASENHTEVFSVPLPKTEHLILTLDLSSLEAEGEIEFLIPAASIEK
ncbi:MAG: hypothetical protein R3C17_19130 [Planctomycetaceae bacterium]